MIVIYHKSEMPKASNVALEDVDTTMIPHSIQYCYIADTVIIVDGAWFRFIKHREISSAAVMHIKVMHKMIQMSQFSVES